MFCTKCGEENDDDAKFCRKCGNHLDPLDDKSSEEKLSEEEINLTREILNHDLTETDNKKRKKRRITYNNKNNKSPKNIPKWAIIAGGCCIGLFILLALVGMITPEKINIDGINFEIPVGYTESTEKKPRTFEPHLNVYDNGSIMYDYHAKKFEKENATITVCVITYANQKDLDDVKNELKNLNKKTIKGINGYYFNYGSPEYNFDGEFFYYFQDKKEIIIWVVNEDIENIIVN